MDDNDDNDENDNMLSLASFFDNERHKPPPYLLEIAAASSDSTAACEKIPLEQDSRDALGGRVWKASIFLRRWLEKEAEAGRDLLGGKTVLDVGAGIGLLGLACALRRININGSSSSSLPLPPPQLVVLTDQSDLLPLLSRNVETVWQRIQQTSEGISPPQCRVEVCPLDWREHGQGPETAALLEKLSLHHQQQEQEAKREKETNEAHRENGAYFDVILVADCVYYEDLYQPLIDTLAALAGPTTKVVICNDDGRTAAKGIEATTGQRWDEDFFFLFSHQFQTVKTEEDAEDREEEDHFFEVGSLLPPEEGGPFRLVLAQKSHEKG